VVLLAQAPVGVTPAELPTAGLLDQLKAGHQLRAQTFTAVGYGTVREDKTGGPHAFFFDVIRRYALQSALNLEKAWLLLSMNPSTGSGGTCYGDSGGPHFLGGVESNLIVSITVTGDAMCRATDKTYRLDTPSGQGLPRRLRRPPLSRPDLSQNPADRHPFSLGPLPPKERILYYLEPTPRAPTAAAKGGATTCGLGEHAGANEGGPGHCTTVLTPG
jgi:hypothetical protein